MPFKIFKSKEINQIFPLMKEIELIVGSELDACKDYKNLEERAINLKFEGTFSFKDIKIKFNFAY